MRQKPQVHRQLLGNKGEDLAVSYLQKHGCRIIARNFKARYGELDIIAIHDNILVFVEVKTRIGHQYGRPEESVTPRKIREVVKTSQYYSMIHPELPQALRIDVIAIELDDNGCISTFQHIKNITL